MNCPICNEVLIEIIEGQVYGCGHCKKKFNNKLEKISEKEFWRLAKEYPEEFERAGEKFVQAEDAKKNPNPYTPKCPTCGSPDVQKIGSVERGVSVLAWGLFSKKINKSFKCNNCGTTW